MKAILALENGQWFEGEAAGAEGSASGEVVFNTSMCGYQEILTDPSYAGQIVTMTAPEIGASCAMLIEASLVPGGRSMSR